MDRTMKNLIVLLLVSSPAWAISTDGNTRLKNLAESEYNQSIKEFENDNHASACEHLKLSKSYIKQTDEKIITDHIIILYDKMCGEKGSM